MKKVDKICKFLVSYSTSRQLFCQKYLWMYLMYWPYLFILTLVITAIKIPEILYVIFRHSSMITVLDALLLHLHEHNQFPKQFP